MTLQQIFYALTISQMGSMNKAAEALFISQPSLTSAIKELEREAGIHIFHRTSKGVSETNEGAEFLMYARQVYQQYELLTQKYGEKGNIKRKFSVSTQHYSFAVKAFVETVKQYDTSKYEFAVWKRCFAGIYLAIHIKKDSTVRFMSLRKDIMRELHLMFFLKELLIRL